MKVRFDGLREVTHVGGVFRMPGEIAELREADARDSIRRGLARPFRDTAVSAPTATTAMRQHEALRKKVGSGDPIVDEGSPPLFVVTPTKGSRAKDLARTLAALYLEAPRKVTICLVLDGPEDGGETEKAVKWSQSYWSGERNKAGVELQIVRHETRKGVNRSRMDAIDQAPRDAVIVEVDDHDTPEPEALLAIISCG